MEEYTIAERVEKLEKEHENNLEKIEKLHDEYIRLGEKLNVILRTLSEKGIEIPSEDENEVTFEDRIKRLEKVLKLKPIDKSYEGITIKVNGLYDIENY